MATLTDLIVVAVEDMLIDHCLEYGIPAERAVVILTEAATRRSGILAFTDHFDCPNVESVAEIIAADITDVEERLFGNCNGDEQLLVECADKAIVVLYISVTQAIGNSFICLN